MPSTYTAVQLTALFCNLRHLFIRLGVISLIIAPLNCRNFENSMCVSKARLDLPDLNGCAPYRQPIFQLSDTRERLCRDRLIPQVLCTSPRVFRVFNHTKVTYFKFRHFAHRSPKVVFFPPLHTKLAVRHLSPV